MKKIIICGLLSMLFMFSMSACEDNAGAKAEYFVTADKTTINEETDQVTITVTATAIINVHISLSTGSFKEKGAIEIQCYMELSGIEYVLYDDLFGVLVTDDAYDFDFNKGDTITRTLKFSRYPVENGDTTTKVMPKGEYKVRVKLQCEKSWTETDIIISAK